MPLVPLLVIRAAPFDAISAESVMSNATVSHWNFPE